MKIVIGQRYMSESEPELGLGVITDMAHKRVTVGFSSVERTYSTENAPIRRALFAVGEEISLVSGDQQKVLSVREEDGITFYLCENGEFSEVLLSDTICFTSPLERLFGGFSDTTREFSLRKKVFHWQSLISQSDSRGFTGGKIELLPHQLSVADSICSATKRRFFLSDEVGLGKTIEACLAIHRLLLTERVERVLIVVPSALLHQWFVELYRRFSILATVVNDDFRARFDESGENLFEFESPVIISDEDIAKNDTLVKSLTEASWDILVVDEAHHLAEQSDSYETVTKLAKEIEGLLLLTASPEAMKDENFFSLLQLVDSDKYSSMEQFKIEQGRYREVASLADAILDKSTSSEDECFLHELLPDSNSIDLSALTKSEREKLVLKLNDICGVGRALYRNSRSVISGFPQRSAQIISVEGVSNSEIYPVELSKWMDQFIRENDQEKCLVICKNRLALDSINKQLSKQNLPTLKKAAYRPAYRKIMKTDRIRPLTTLPI